MSEIAETIGPKDAREIVGRGEAKVIDIRPLDEIERGKPPGSFAVGEDGDPKETAEQVLRGEDKPVIVVGSDDDSAAQVSSDLREEGISASALEGGWDGWVSAGNQIMPQADEEYEGPELVQPGAEGMASEDDSETVTDEEE